MAFKRENSKIQIKMCVFQIFAFLLIPCRFKWFADCNHQIEFKAYSIDCYNTTALIISSSYQVKFFSI